MFSPVKIALIALIVGVVLMTNIVATPSVFKKHTPEETTSAPAENLKKTPMSLKNPLTWFNYPAGQSSLRASPAISEPTEEKSVPQKIFGELKNLLTGETNTTQINGVDIDNYYSELAKAEQNTGGFTIEEFTAVKKDEYDRPLFPEELFKFAESGDNPDIIKISFRAWQELAERYLVNLEKITVADALLPTHQALIDWVEYFIETHRLMGSGNLSKTETDSLLDQYRQKAKTELPKIQKVLSLSQPTVSVNLNKFLTLIPKVFAQGQTLTCDFGGPIRSWSDTCTNGVGIVLTPPPGKNFCGVLFLNYLTIVVNYYEYGYFWPGSCILGKARRGPGVCNKTKTSYALGSAVIMYFGSAPTTNFCLIK